MLRNYLTVALRALLRHKLYSVINLAGLAIGMTCFLLILVYLQGELRYDRFHAKAERIFRLVMEQKTTERVTQNALSVAPAAPILEKEYPEVERVVRIRPLDSPTVLVRAGERRFYESRVMYADPGIFEVFSFPLTNGDPSRVLRDPFSMVITESLARKFFGDEDPVGKIILLHEKEQFTVTGVMADVPENSHIRFDFLISFATLYAIQPEVMNDWMFNPYFTYVLLREGARPDLLNEKIAGIVTLHAADVLKEVGWEVRAYLQPLLDIHLYPLVNEHEPQGDIDHVYLFGGIAVLILLIGCVNFMNLTTARALTRVREVGLRKVVGATPPQLLRQFLGEAVLQSYLALVLAAILTEVLLPAFGGLTGRQLGVSVHDLPVVVAGLLLLGLVVGLLAGSYPAYVITAARPVESVKGAVGGGRERMTLRRALVVLQFAIAVFLVVGTATAYRQLEFLRNKKLGFEQDQVLVVPLRDSSVIARAQELRTEIQRSPSVRRIALASRPPGRGAWGFTVHAGNGPVERIAQAKYFFIDDEYLETLGISIVAGRNFSRGHATDAVEAVILNEHAARVLGWTPPQEAIGQRVRMLGESNVPVIGVVQDYNFQPLRVSMQPLVLMMRPEACEYMLVRAAGGGIPAAISSIRQAWETLAPAWPFSFSFLDEDLDQLYRSEERFGQMFASFSILAILIACLGLFGLVASSTERRRKEIGVRKVLGASVPGLVLLFSRELAALVLAANVIAWPLAYLGMSRWLEDFAYRAPLGPGIFVFAGALTFVIALLTVAAQAVKAALANPVDALRYE